MSQFDQLVKATAQLGDAVVDPTTWPRVMGDLCHAMQSTGAILLQSDARTVDVPRTPSLDQLSDIYFRDGWHERDIRGIRGVPRFLAGETVFIDQDLFTPAELRRLPYYNELMIPNGFHWFAAVAIRAGPAFWALCLQRSAREGAFQLEEKHQLHWLSQRLTENATLSALVSRSVLTATTNALNIINQPALSLDHFGLVLHNNSSAEKLFDDEIRIKNRRLWVADKSAQGALAQFVDRLRVTPDDSALPTAPIVVRRTRKPPLQIRALGVEAAARSPFLGARALLLLYGEPHSAQPSASLLLGATHRLTPAEARLALELSSGSSLSDASAKFGITYETARSQLRSIFSKTDTHRQSQLVALITRLQVTAHQHSRER